MVGIKEPCPANVAIFSLAPKNRYHSGPPNMMAIWKNAASILIIPPNISGLFIFFISTVRAPWIPGATVRPPRIRFRAHDAYPSKAVHSPLNLRNSLTRFCHCFTSSWVAIRLPPARPISLNPGWASKRPRYRDFSQNQNPPQTARTHMTRVPVEIFPHILGELFEIEGFPPLLRG